MLRSNSSLQRKRGTDIYYTALGDSIARGIGASNDYGYVEYIKRFLATKYNRVRLNNQSIPGVTSTLLLLQLKLDFFTRIAIKEADVITISIGGDNLLGCAANNYTVIDSNCAANGVEDFANDWPLILKEIRQSLRSKAKIYVMTLYNPYTRNEQMYPSADTYINGINNDIFKYASTYEYKVVDVYKDFLGQFSNGMWKICKWTHFCESNRNPHPTDSGHQRIALLHEMA